MGEYLVRQSVWTKNPMRWMKGPRVSARMRLPRRIGKEEMARLWAAAEARTERTRALARCVLAVLYGTGLRRGEMERLDLRHWDREAGVLRIDGRKTGQERQVPVGAGVWRCLEAYLPQRQKRLEAAGRLEEEPALFVNCRGGRLDGASITALVQTCCRRAQIPYVSMHQFRHSCASDLLENGVKLPQVQKVLGHAHIGSTMRYLDVTHGARTEAIRRHPINEFLTTPAVERKVAG
jgi:site-specific recombinase XerD